jgi:hypothetical protein
MPNKFSKTAAIKILPSLSIFNVNNDGRIWLVGIWVIILFPMKPLLTKQTKPFVGMPPCQTPQLKFTI